MSQFKKMQYEVTNFLICQLTLILQKKVAWFIKWMAYVVLKKYTEYNEMF